MFVQEWSFETGEHGTQPEGKGEIPVQSQEGRFVSGLRFSDAVTVIEILTGFSRRHWQPLKRDVVADGAVRLKAIP
jgi:hypothetical protein